MENQNQNWKCVECGHVCGAEKGIVSHYRNMKKKGKEHKGKAIAIPTSEPKVNSGGWNNRGRVKPKGKPKGRPVRRIEPERDSLGDDKLLLKSYIQVVNSYTQLVNRTIQPMGE